MILEIVAGVQQGAAVDYFQKLVEWADRQIAIGVLGQAATTEGTPGRLGADDAQPILAECAAISRTAPTNSSCRYVRGGAATLGGRCPWDPLWRPSRAATVAFAGLIRC